MEIGENLKRIRKEMQLTQQELARMSGVKQATISAIEKGRNHPTTPTLEMLAKAMNRKISELMSESMGSDEPIRSESREEEELLQIFRQLNSDGRALVIEAAISYLKRQSLRQEGAISSMG